ncbi:MAG: ATP-binding protein [Chloroflexi bacterium]|nr:ATP-binding protein [Chloroflexota bacterium]
MLTSFVVERYRGLEDVKVPTLGQFNLFTGMNGVGKTSLGEALWLFHGRDNPPLLWNPHVQRTERVGSNPLLKLGGSPISIKAKEAGVWSRLTINYEEQVSPLMPQRLVPPASTSAGEERFRSAEKEPGVREALQVSTPLGRLVIEYEEDGQSRKEVQDVVLHPLAGQVLLPGVRKRTARPSAIILVGSIPWSPVGDTVERMSRVIQAGHKDKLVDFLRLVHPSVKNIEIITEQAAFSIVADIGLGQLVPIEALGGGAVRSLILFVSVYTAQNGLLVVDEIENGIHHQVLPVLWSQVFQLCRQFDVQLFATTHSLECVRAAVQASQAKSKGGIGESKEGYDLWIHKLYKARDLVRVESYSREKLRSALELDLELR